MSGECDKCGEHCLDCRCNITAALGLLCRSQQNSSQIIKDFEYRSIRIKKPDGTYMTGFKIIDLPEGEKGQVSRFLNNSKKSKS